MRRTLKRLTALTVVAAIGFLLYKITVAINYKTATDEHTVQIPAFTFYHFDGTKFTNDSLSGGRSTIIICFNTGCEHCQYEIEIVTKNAAKLQHADFLLASIQPVWELKKFDSAYQLWTYPFIKLLHDKENVMYNVFGINSVPTIFIYNTNKQRVKKYTGEVKIETIIHAINNQ